MADEKEMLHLKEKLHQAQSTSDGLRAAKEQAEGNLEAIKEKLESTVTGMIPT